MTVVGARDRALNGEKWEADWLPHEAYQRLAGLLVGCSSVLPADEGEWIQLAMLARQEVVGPLLASALRAHPEIVVPDAAKQILDRMYRESVRASLPQVALRRRLCRR